jgi:outer membrane immunogenic protein
MRSLPCGLIGYLLGIATACAADIEPIYQPVVPPPPRTWTGPYVGIAGGWGFGYVDNSSLPAFTVLEKLNGPLVGGFLGYDHQIGSLVLGVAADGYASWIGNDRTVFGVTVRDEVSAFGTLRARVGYATPASLVYITAGGLYGQFKTTAGVVSIAESRAGFAAGAGSEWRFAPNWAVKSEFMYLRSTEASNGTFVWATNVTLGVGYRF